MFFEFVSAAENLSLINKATCLVLSKPYSRIYAIILLQIRGIIWWWYCKLITNPSEWFDCISYIIPITFRKQFGEQRNFFSISSFQAHTCHPISTDCCFKVIYKIPSKYSVNIRFRLLCIAEALAIHTFNPDLCCQKRYTVSLSLPWT